MDDTGERLIPEMHKDNWKLVYAEHYLRYQSAVSISENKTVLDIACGTGYGSKMLSKVAKKVIGVDNSKHSINYAKEHYSAKNIEYLVGDAQKIDLKDHPEIW